MWGRPIPRAFVLASILLGVGERAFAQPCEPSFRSGTPLDFIQPNYSVIGAFDFNGDGRKDLLFTTPSAARIALNAGNGVFKVPDEVLYFGASVAVGDMDGDGILDLVAVGPGITYGSSFIGVYKGFVTYQKSSVYFQNVTSIAGPLGAGSPVLGDFDGNGTLDLAVLVNGLYVWIYPGDGHGGLGEPRSISINNVFSASQLWAADLNGDGRADLLIIGYGFKSTLLKTWISNANGSFTDISDGPRGGGYESGFSLVLSDVDGDGRTDVVVTNILGLTRANGSIETYLSRPGGFVHVSRASSPLWASVLADFDGDGRPDLAALEASGLTLVVQLGDGAGKFADPIRFTLPAAAGILTAADFDGDGHVDLVLSGLPDRAAQLYRNTCGRGIERTLVVPVVVSLPGAAGTYWESDLTITNSGSKNATVDITYTAATGGGSGTVTAALPAGAQLSSPSAFELLSTLGLNVPAGVPRSGTLHAVFHNLASAHAAGISVRTSSGGAGVAYAGIEPPPATSQVVADLRQNPRDRSNLGVMHAGTASDGPINLYITLTTTDAGPVQTYPLPIVTLQPGEFRQFDRVLATSGLSATSATANISSLTGPGIPFVSWGVVNDDTGTSDGSFQLGQAWDSASWALPSVVESPSYETELTLVNSNGGSCSVTLVYHSSSLASPGGAAVLTVPLPGLRTYRFDDIVGEFRRADPAGVGPRGPTYVGTLEVGGCARVFAFSRVLGTAKRYGVAPNGIVRPLPNPGYVPSLHSAWIPNLRQDDAVRSNLVIVNLDWHSVPYLVELFDPKGRKVASREVRTSTSGWIQINGILSDWAPGTTRGWARISELEPQYAFSFAAYAVLNDGASPGLGTGDGSIVWMDPDF